MRPTNLVCRDIQFTALFPCWMGGLPEYDVGSRRSIRSPRAVRYELQASNHRSHRLRPFALPNKLQCPCRLPCFSTSGSIPFRHRLRKGEFPFLYWSATGDPSGLCITAGIGNRLGNVAEDLVAQNRMHAALALHFHFDRRRSIARVGVRNSWQALLAGR